MSPPSCLVTRPSVITHPGVTGALTLLHFYFLFRSVRVMRDRDVCGTLATAHIPNPAANRPDPVANHPGSEEEHRTNASAEDPTKRRGTSPDVWFRADQDPANNAAQHAGHQIRAARTSHRRGVTAAYPCCSRALSLLKAAAVPLCGV